MSLSNLAQIRFEIRPQLKTELKSPAQNIL